MINIVTCASCKHLEICKYQESFTEELELLRTLKNKFEHATVNVSCKHYIQSVFLGKRVVED